MMKIVSKFPVLKNIKTVLFFAFIFLTFPWPSQASDNQIVPFTMNISGTLESNLPVLFSVEGSDQSDADLYYKFFYCANYGTADYENSPWVVMQPYSLDNSCTFTFPSDGTYIVVARVVSDPENEPAELPIIGSVVAIGNTNAVHISGLSSDSDGPVNSGTAVTYTANASSGNGDDIYFKWFYRGNHGTNEYENSPWVVVQDYATENTCEYVFPNKGQYIVVVRAVTDPESEPEDLPIIGGTAVCQSTDTEQSTIAVGTQTWSSEDTGAAEMDVWLKQGTSYSISDLCGTWSSHSLATAPGGPWWERATLEIEADGSYQADVTDSNEASYSLSGALQISSYGTVSQNGGNTFSGNLDVGKTVIASTDTWSSGDPGASEIKMWVKQADTYSISDLQGTWTFHGLASGSDSPWWIRGTATINADGFFVASLVEIDGEEDTVTGQFNIDQNGAITMTGRDSWEFQGNLNANKTVLVSTETWTTDSPGASEMKIWVRQNTPYTVSDLQGLWAVQGIASRNSSLWRTRGSLEIQTTGKARVTLIDQDGSPTAETVNISITQEGVLAKDDGTDFTGAVN